ncbi:MAG: hypothetical protein ACHQK9_01820 [Reyranellales bacterium]
MLRRAAVAALLCIPSFGAQAQQPSAQAFLEDLYRPYLQKNYKGQPYTEAARFFVPDLARAMDRDMAGAKRRGEPPTLDGDPFVDAQEWQVTDLVIRVSGTGDLATGVVSFANFGKPKRLAIDLRKTPAGWRIADIAGSSGSLRALYKPR